MATKRLALIAAFAALLGIGALTATARAYTCTTYCYSANSCTTTCF
jgi:hypothetical protein